MPGDRFIELALAEDRHVLDVLFRHAREAVTVQDQSGNLVYANDTAATLVGLKSGVELLSIPVADLVGLFEMIDESGQPIKATDLPGRQVLSGLDAPEVTVGYRAPGSKKVRWSRVNASPIKNDAGEVVWAINFFLDITEQVMERESERILARVNDVLAPWLTVSENLISLSEFLAAEFGAWTEIHLTDNRGDLVPAAWVLPDLIESIEGTDPAVDRRIPLGSDLLQARVMKTGQLELIDDAAGAVTGSLSRLVGWGNLIDRSEIRSVVCLPVGGRTPQGTLTLARGGGPEGAFERADLMVLRRIAEKATVALANAKLFELEHETAEALRSGLAPTSTPDIEGMQLSVRYEPLARLGHIGGDFYDVLPMSQSEWAVVVGDIEGKGVPAAASVGVARDTLRATIKLQPDPAVVLTQLNDALRSQEHPRMCTVSYLRLARRADGFDARVTLAGHPPPALLTSDGTLSFQGQPCPPAGVLPALDPHEVVVRLSAGDTLLVYTDGFALPGETPVETIQRFIAGGESESLDSLLDRMLHELHDQVEAVRDDILLLAMRVA